MTIEEKLDTLINTLENFIIKTQENFENIQKRFDHFEANVEIREKRLFESQQNNTFFKSQSLHLEKSIYDRDQQQVERHVFYLEQFKRLESRLSAIESKAA